MSILDRHKRIPGQMVEATSPVSAAKYMELERKLEQDRELDGRAKRILRKLIKAVGGLGAITVSVLGIGTVINSLKSAKKAVEEVAKEAEGTAEIIKGIPKETDDINNVSKMLGLEPVEVYQKLDRQYSRTWLEKLMKEKRASVGFDFIPVSRKDKGKFGLLRMAFKKHYGGYDISYDPHFDMLRIGPKGIKIPTPIDRSVHNLAAAIHTMKKQVELVFSRNPGLKNTPAHQSYLEAIKEVDQVLAREGAVSGMKGQTLTKFALELANVRDILDKTIRDDTALMNLFMTIEKEMKEKALQRQRIIGRWGLDVSSEPMDIKKEKPSVVKDRMEQLHVLLGKPEFVDQEARMIMGKLEADIKTIAPVQKVGASYELPRYDQKLIPKYASDISHAQSFIKHKLIQAGTIEEAATGMDLAMMKAIVANFPYTGKAVLF